MNHFAIRLAAAVRCCGNPVVVGLDPRLESLPKSLQPATQAPDRQAIAHAYESFCRDVIDVVAPLVPAVKPQAAFFEQLGPAGMNVLAKVIDYANQNGLIVVLDAKRSDIGSTAEAYADAYLGPGPASAWGADALTVNPYLGDDSLEPFVSTAIARGAGLFVLVKTSNPGGKMLQDLDAEGQPLYHYVARHVEKLAQNSLGESQYGSVGAVVGATYPEQLAELRTMMPHAWLLVPGYGSQGGTAADVAAAFDAEGLGAIINSSRGIIFAHRRREFADTYGEGRWQAAVEAATLEMIEQLQASTPAGRLV